MTRRRPTRRDQARQVEAFDPLALRNLQEVLRERLERTDLDDFPPRDFLGAGVDQIEWLHTSEGTYRFNPYTTILDLAATGTLYLRATDRAGNAERNVPMVTLTPYGRNGGGRYCSG